MHDYFGAKRALYLEVVRDLVRLPPQAPQADYSGGVEERVHVAIDRWLTMVERNRETWLAALGAEGFGRDADVEAILEEARETAAARFAEGIKLDPPGGEASPVCAALHAFTGMAEAASASGSSTSASPATRPTLCSPAPSSPRHRNPAAPIREGSP